MAETGAPPKVLLVAAAVVAVALAVVVAVVAVTSSPGSSGPSGAAGASESAEADGPLALVSVPAPQAGSPECASLVKAVSPELESGGGTLERRELAKPAPEAAVAWGTGEPVVLRCGLDRPPELTRTANLRVINGVQWLQVPGPGTATWWAVDRPVYVALTVPSGEGTGPLQQTSDTIGRTLPEQPLRFE